MEHAFANKMLTLTTAPKKSPPAMWTRMKNGFEKWREIRRTPVASHYPLVENLYLLETRSKGHRVRESASDASDLAGDIRINRAYGVGLMRTLGIGMAWLFGIGLGSVHWTGYVIGLGAFLLFESIAQFHNHQAKKDSLALLQLAKTAPTEVKTVVQNAFGRSD